MSDEFEDFWQDIRPPPRPKPPALPWLGTVPEKGNLWFAVIQENDDFKGHVPPRIKATIPDGNPMDFTLTFQVDAPMTIVGVEMYDRQYGGELLYTAMFPHAFKATPVDTLNVNLTLSDSMEERMQNLAGLRTGLRLRGLL